MRDVADDTFGGRLRTARLQRGMSQATLGGESYSASYISHLESGRRHPTAEVTEHLARKLGLTAADLTHADAERLTPTLRDVALIEAEARIYGAALTRDYESVIDEVNYIHLVAEDNLSTWWRLTWSKAESQLALGAYSACRKTALDLAQSALAQASPDLRGTALALVSRAERASGHLQSALMAAQRAVGCAPTSSATRAAALRELVACHAELGDLDEAALAASSIQLLRTSITDSQLLGLIAWTIGNVAFVTGDTVRGAAEHDVASNLLRPEADLRLWGRFHKASAAMHLHSGNTRGADTALSRAEQGLGLAGNASDKAELLLLRAERAMKDEPQQALELVRRGLDSVNLPQQTRAEALVVQARALHALNQRDDAKTALKEAALTFDSVGAHRRSSEIWRELATDDERG